MLMLKPIHYGGEIASILSRNGLCYSVALGLAAQVLLRINDPSVNRCFVRMLRDLIVDAISISDQS